LGREIRRRLRARESLHTYALSIDIPTVPWEAPIPDEELLGPASGLMAAHHAKILEVIERTVKRPYGRAIIMAPPGSAKSLYASVLTPTWVMGRNPGARLILTSYASGLAERQARRAMQIVQQDKYQLLWDENPQLDRDAAKEWTLTNKSEMLSMGLLGGLTGNRANGAIIDDPVAGREEADSEDIRQKILDAYQDDLLTRLLPGAWVILIMTRWHEADLAGSILPDDYDGHSGMVKCRDGLEWEVLNIQAKCERKDDPLGRQLGEYLWTDFYPPQHWQMFEKAQGAEAARTWSSLYQQRPTPQGSGRFTYEMFDFYKPGAQPPLLAYVGAGDYAVTAGGNDFTELGVFGVDPEGGLWEVDWWNKQCTTDESTERTLDMVKRWKIPMWFNEGGVIDKAMGPLLNLRMRQRHVFCDRRAMPSMQDKVAKCASFQGRAASGMVHFRDNANSRRIVQQLCALPAGRFDDAADVCGLVGRAVDQFVIPRVASRTERKSIQPFSAAWLEYSENETKQLRYR
jgi:hypothetical protein